MYVQAESEYWYLRKTYISHSCQDNVVCLDFRNLGVGESVGLLVTRDGDLHLFVDGKHREMVWSRLPIDQLLWGVADVYGNCVKIKADILCGKW